MIRFYSLFIMLTGAIYDATQSYLYDFHVNTLIFLLAMLIFACVPLIHLRRRMAEKRRELGAPKGLGGAANIIEMTKLFIRGLDAEDSDHEHDHGVQDGSQPEVDEDEFRRTQGYLME